MRCRQIGKKCRRFSGDRQIAVGAAHARQILLAGLLHDRKPRAQGRLERLDRRRHHVGHDARALAAAKNEKPQRIGDRRISRGRCGDDGRPHRITGERRLGGEPRPVAKHVGKGRGDGGDARRQQPVGAADDGIGIVDHGRHAAPGRGQHRRQRRIAAEADHRRGLEPSDQRPCLRKAGGERCGGLRQGNRIARPQRGACDHVHGLVDEGAAVARGAPVGRKMHRDAARNERGGERLGGKQMPARSAGRHKNRRTAAGEHQAALGASMGPPERCACGRSRVSAISMPMP